MRILNEGMRLAGRYTLIRRLGAGGMAEVWLADDRQSGTRVALKFAAGNAGDGDRQKTLLNREWRIGSRLMHANIVRVFEFHDDPDGAYYGLQHIGETDLGVLAGTDPAEALRPVAMIADALRYAHGKGIVHRDIKASNILLDSHGLPYLMDFGVACAPGVDEITGGGSAAASSPQQQAGTPADSSDDIYALGVLMQELLTGVPPGVATPDNLSLPVEIKELLADMLADNAGQRPNAEVVAQRLQAAGISPAPAPARYITGVGELDEVIETMEAVPTESQKTRASATRTEAPVGSSGISPRVLYGGLATALVLFLVVIFVLPRTPDNDAAPIVDIVEQPASPSFVEPLPESEGESQPAVLVPSAPAGDRASFSENIGDRAVSESARIKAATDEALGDLLSQLQRLRFRAIDRWGGQDYLDAVDLYAAGDQAYIGRDYPLAGDRYREAISRLEPFFDRIDDVFAESLAAAKGAFDSGDHVEAIRLFDLAVSITPGNREAEDGLARAQNLQVVLDLMEQGMQFEADLEHAAARRAFEKALDIDSQWQPASIALARVNAAIKQLSFEQRMTEGFAALSSADFASARAAFNAAKVLEPASRQPADGLQQVDQESRLYDIRRLEKEAAVLDNDEQWESAVFVYEDLLKIDPDLQFAQQGLAMARSRSALHARLAGLIGDPDELNDPVTMRDATSLLLNVTRMEPMGPRLADQKSSLARLLKRAATPLSVLLVSDNLTNVAIFKVGQFGTFATQELSLRPGVYIAVGNRPGYRDVRIEFRVSPEIDMQPIVIQCEEQI